MSEVVFIFGDNFALVHQAVIHILQYEPGWQLVDAIEVNQLYVTLWEETEENTWYIGAAHQLIMTQLLNLSLTICTVSRQVTIIINNDIPHLGIL